jgi:glucose/arabinose dehydrogenase
LNRVFSRRLSRSRLVSLLGVLGLLGGGCSSESAPPAVDGGRSSPCDADNGGLILAEGFCAAVVADYLGSIRHLAIAGRDRIYLTVRHRQLNLGGLIALGDPDGDGRFEQASAFGEARGLGIAVHGNTLYFAGDDTLWRYRLPDPGGGIVPTAPPEAWVTDIGSPLLDRGGNGLAIEISGDSIYLAVGTTSNACQPPEHERQPGVPGMYPCPLREREASVWRIRTGVQPGSLEEVGERLVVGWRFGVAMAWDPLGGAVLSAGHARDQLHDLWPESFTLEDDRKLPREALRRLLPGSDFGWPYCLLEADGYRRAPEYARVKELDGFCEALSAPLAIFPAHSSPNGLVVGAGPDWPARYREGAFVALYGAYDEALAGVGRRVVFLPRSQGRFGAAEDFVRLAPEPGTSAEASGRYRLSGLAQGPDGSLYLADSMQGRVWRIIPREADTPAR